MNAALEILSFPLVGGTRAKVEVHLLGSTLFYFICKKILGGGGGGGYSKRERPHLIVLGSSTQFELNLMFTEVTLDEVHKDGFWHRGSCRALH